MEEGEGLKCLQGSLFFMLKASQFDPSLRSSDLDKNQ